MVEVNWSEDSSGTHICCFNRPGSLANNFVGQMRYNRTRKVWLARLKDQSSDQEFLTYEKAKAFVEDSVEGHELQSY